MIAANIGLLLAAIPGAVSGPAHPVGPGGPDTTCIVMNEERLPLEQRKSPLDSLTFGVGRQSVKICYGSPSARGRTMIGGHEVPYGKLWRTGANEPTMIHTTAPIYVADIRVDPGTYSLYTIPGEQSWVVIINRSITQWGHIAQYNYKVKEQELGSAEVASERLEQHVETMRFVTEPAAGGVVDLKLEWEHTRVRIPVRPAES